MTIEEKAKAYDERLAKARKEYSMHEANNAIGIIDALERVFPELKESEDEKIRTAIIYFISHTPTVPKGIIGKETMISWLEKQGKNNMGISETTKQKLEDNLNKALEKETPESCNEFLEKQGEQNLANSAKTCKDEQKHAWSEEYEKRIKNIEESLLAYKIIVMDNDMELANYIEKDIEWLKSLKERYTWKPSDEQMDAINDAIDYLGGNTKIVRKHLMSLYEQLKKLKG